MVLYDTPGTPALLTYTDPSQLNSVLKNTTMVSRGSLKIAAGTRLLAARVKRTPCDSRKSAIGVLAARSRAAGARSSKATEAAIARRFNAPRAGTGSARRQTFRSANETPERRAHSCQLIPSARRVA